MIKTNKRSIKSKVIGRYYSQIKKNKNNKDMFLYIICFENI
jgi:hypothetical protein